MKKTIKKIFAVVLALALTATAALAADQSNAKESVQAAAETITEKYNTASLQYALIDNGKVTLSGNAGFYSKTENRAVTSRTMYGIGSVSKMFTAAAAMKLVDLGRLDLDKPVVTYIPEFNMKDDRYKKITARMLLNHSSGLYGTTFQNASLFDDNDRSAHDNLLSHLSTQKLKADPGAFSVYCNDGFSLLELLVERISGKTFSEFIEENFSKPLGLINTKTPLDAFDKTGLAKTYSPLFENALPADTIDAIGAGGLYSTAEELCKFGEMLIGSNPIIFSESSVEKMQQPEYKNGIWPDETENGIGYGLGWDSVDLAPFNEYGIKAVSKGGDTMFYHASLIALPEYNLVASVLSSSGSSTVDGILATKILLEALKQKGVIKDINYVKTFNPPVKAEMPQELKQYAGLYGATGATVNITMENSELKISFPAGSGLPEQIYLYTGDNKFTSKDGSATLKFVRERNGLTYLQVKNYITLPGIGQSVMTTYNCEKLDKNKLGEDVINSWKNRNGKKYFVINEKATSQAYISAPFTKLTVDLDNGYSFGCKIADKNYAENVLQIPVVNGRDCFDLNFSEKNGVEYLKSNADLMICENGLVPIWSGNKSVCTIGAEGYTKWYKVPDYIKNKTMTVAVPKNASFAVYTGDGRCVNYSAVSNKNETVLPQNGYIAFIGNAGAAFDVSLR
ncbi:MAG: serine hydrolase domain-containing protein [Bacillota bacterium]|nr:serine hydrolase domain-containing protein [Bacillota bacterium]